MFLDAYALIVQRDLDGGDTLHHEAMYAFGQKIIYDHLKNEVLVQSLPEVVQKPSRSPASDIINKLEVKPGIYVRHPDPQKWYSNPNTTSRDQVIPVIAYCAAYEDYDRLWRLFKATLERGMFAQNYLRIGDGENTEKIPDPMHLNIAQFIRAGGWWTAPLYPLLFVFDTVDLVGTLLTALPWHFQDDHLIPRERMPDDVDDNNTVIQHVLAVYYKPTPISALNRYLYSVTRAENLGNTVLGERNTVMGALSWYHRDGYGGGSNPEIAELYRPLIERHFTYPTLTDWIAEELGLLALPGVTKLSSNLGSQF